MKIIRGLTKGYHLARVSIFLVAVALIAGLAGCSVEIPLEGPIGIAVGVAIAVAAFVFVMHVVRESFQLKRVISRFMEAGAARDIEAAYACCSHSSCTREAVAELIEGSCDAFQDYKRITISEHKSHWREGTERRAWLKGKIIYRGRKQAFWCSLVKERDGWKIAGLPIGSTKEGVVGQAVPGIGGDEPSDLKRPKAVAATTAKSQPRGNLFHDRSLWLLLASNAVTILVAVLQNWDLIAVMRVYWFQSVAIGFTNFLRIRRLREFSTEGFTINGLPVEPTQRGKNRTARFFLLHYGGFHLGYFLFLFLQGSSLTDLMYTLPVALLFVGNHLYSYSRNRPTDTGRPNIGTLMFYPYARIVPMHLTLVLGFFISSPLLFFLLLKTLADAIMHVVEHRVLLRRGQQQA
jgi:hypothetical protein